MPAHEKWIPEKFERATKIPRPQLESSRQEEFKSASTILVKFMFGLFFQSNFPNIVQKKIVKEEPDSPHRILLFQGLNFFWGASVCTGIIFLGSLGSQADVRTLDNIVLACTSDILIRLH